MYNFFTRRIGVKKLNLCNYKVPTYNSFKNKSYLCSYEKKFKQYITPHNLSYNYVYLYTDILYYNFIKFCILYIVKITTAYSVQQTL